MNLGQWLGLTVLAAAVTTFGTLLGIVIKEYFFSRSFERWKRRQDLATVYERFRDPLVAAAADLATRLSEIIKHYPVNYLHSSVLDSRPERQIENDFTDPYFQRYKLVSTLFRFFSFFGWLELYRQEVTFLWIGNERHSEALRRILNELRSDLADGDINTAPNRQEWHDTLIFREELRAIGEAMIEARGAEYSIMGYGRFCQLLESEGSNTVKSLTKTVTNFFVDPDKSRPDFRIVRVARLVVRLVALVELLSQFPLGPGLVEAREQGLMYPHAWS